MKKALLCLLISSFLAAISCENCSDSVDKTTIGIKTQMDKSEIQL